MNPTLLSEQDKSQIDNRAMDFGIGPGIFIKLLKSDRFYLDEKRQAQQEELEIAASQQGIVWSKTITNFSNLKNIV